MMLYSYEKTATVHTAKIASMTDAVCRIVGAMPKGTRFHGNELHDAVSKLYPAARRMYPDTVLRMMRRHCKFQYRTIDHNKGLFEKV
jgi:hypothetical protein